MFIELAAVAQGTGEWLRRGGVNAGKVLNGIPALKRMQDVILLPGMNCEEVGSGRQPYRYAGYLPSFQPLKT